MHDNLESLLLGIHGELYSSIKGKAVDVLGLSMDIYESVFAIYINYMTALRDGR